MTLDQRFEDKVIPEPNSGCWLWDGAASKGYGQIGVGGKLLYAHRVSWERTHGDIPEGSHVLHRCDVTLCVNPDHLFLGTHKDNMRDMAKKGRQRSGARGVTHGSARLTEEQVLAIRKDLRPQAEIAIEHGISQPTVSDIKNGRRWKHL